MAKADEREKKEAQHGAQEPTWQELPKGALMVEPGSAERYRTGDWRTERPIWSAEKCTSCLLCWIFCPDSSILVEDGKVIGIDYEHCKGCGICAAECPPRVNAIEMKPEADYR